MRITTAMICTLMRKLKVTDAVVEAKIVISSISKKQKTSNASSNYYYKKKATSFKWRGQPIL